MTQAENTTGKAYVSEASGNKQTAPQTFMQDMCFLCSQKIGESDPRQFYTGPPGSSGVMMLAHTGCLNKFKANGEVWPTEDKPTPTPAPATLGGFQRVMHGKARLEYGKKSLAVLCNNEIAEHGLKAVIPDLIVALRAAEESL